MDSVVQQYMLEHGRVLDSSSRGSGMSSTFKGISKRHRILFQATTRMNRASIVQAIQDKPLICRTTNHRRAFSNQCIAAPTPLRAHWFRTFVICSVHGFGSRFAERILLVVEPVASCVAYIHLSGASVVVFVPQLGFALLALALAPALELAFV